MLTFREITLEDRNWAQVALKASDFRSCEYCFANNLAWHRGADTKVAEVDGFYLLCSFDTEDGAPHFVYPAGTGDLKKLVKEMEAFSNARNHPLVITGLTAETKAILESLFPEKFRYTLNRDGSDYLYDTKKFIALQGKKYHKKRNHLKQFSGYGAVFSPMTHEDFEECIAFAAGTYNEKGGYTDASSVVEQYAIHTFFSNFDALELSGGVLRVDGTLVAFSIGEPISKDTFGVHIEKADIRYHGAYTAIANAFAGHFAKEYPYLNREEDLGLPGLRQSKLSYYPVEILEKWTAIAR